MRSSRRSGEAEKHIILRGLACETGLCYHAFMRKLDFSRVCGLYLILMSSLFLLAVSPKGYLNIVETKYAVFCSLTALLLLAFFVLCIRKNITRGNKWSAIHFLILAYWAWSLVSTVCSPWRRTAFLGEYRCDGFITITLYCAVFLILSLYGDDFRFPLWLPAAALSLLCLVAILQFFDLNPLRLYPAGLRWSGRERDYNGAFLSLTGNADLTASVLCTGFAFLWPLGMRKNNWLFLLPAILCLIVLFASGVRAGMVGAAASIFFCLPAVLPIRRKGKRIVRLLLFLLCFCILLFIYYIPLPGTAGELNSLLHGQAQDSFGSGRIYIWKEVCKLVKERPILGGGPDTLGERGLAFVKTAPDGTVIRRTIDCAHCEALNVVVNQGVPALLLLAAAVILTLLRVVKSCGVSCMPLVSAFLAYLSASLFGIGMPANTAYFWLIWAVLLCKTGKMHDDLVADAI